MSDKKLGELPDDGRENGEYESKYPLEIRKQQWREAIYIFILIVSSLLIIAVNYIGCFVTWFSFEGELARKMIYCLSAGLLGGAAFDMKCFYRAVARDQWNKDRVFWRVFSPFVSISFALVLGSIFSGNITSGNGFDALMIGFFSGYFSDEAASKMYDVALTLFSKSGAKSDDV